jgi:hypothetical protein
MASQGVDKIKEFTKSLLRKIRNVEYKNVPLIPGYEKSEEEYTALKTSLQDTNILIKDLMSFEYGNRYLKTIKSGIAILSEKSTLNLYKNKDMFEEMSLMARRMSMMKIDSECKRSAENFSDAYNKISEQKKILNTRLESIRLQLKEKRNQCVEIDRHRKRIKNMRYDLEKLLQDEGYNGEIREVEKKEFSKQSSEVLKMMIQFVEDASIGSVLKGIAREYSNYLKETAETLKSAE